MRRAFPSKSHDSTVSRAGSVKYRVLLCTSTATETGLRIPAQIRTRLPEPSNPDLSILGSAPVSVQNRNLAGNPKKINRWTKEAVASEQNSPNFTFISIWFQMMTLKIDFKGIWALFYNVSIHITWFGPWFVIYSLPFIGVNSKTWWNIQELIHHYSKFSIECWPL